VFSYAALLVPSFLVSPGLIQKLFGARDERAVRRGVGVQGACLLVYSLLPVILGMAALARFPHLDNRELALPTVMLELLPGWLGGLLLAAVFSAEAGAADAVLFMLSTSLVRDLLPVWRKKTVSDGELLRLTRLTAAAAGSAAILLAIWLPSVLDALTVFYTLLSVALTAPLLAGLYSRRPAAPTALAAIAAAVPAAAAAHLLSRGRGWGGVSPAGLGIAISALVFGLSSLSHSAARRARQGV